MIVWKNLEKFYGFLAMVMDATCWIWLTRPENSDATKSIMTRGMVLS
jgi:hypothetical protein